MVEALLTNESIESNRRKCFKVIVSSTNKQHRGKEIIEFIMNQECDAYGQVYKEKGDAKVNDNETKSHKNGAENGKLDRKNFEEFESMPLWIAVMTYIAYAILILFGYLRDFMRYYGLEKSRAFKERGNEVCEGF